VSYQRESYVKAEPKARRLYEEHMHGMRKAARWDKLPIATRNAWYEIYVRSREEKAAADRKRSK
jgi:hypothetical protein